MEQQGNTGFRFLTSYPVGWFINSKYIQIIRRQCLYVAPKAKQQPKKLKFPTPPGNMIKCHAHFFHQLLKGKILKIVDLGTEEYNQSFKSVLLKYKW